MKKLFLIPARGGSKGLPRKNILPLAGRPMIEYTLDAAIGAMEDGDELFLDRKGLSKDGALYKMYNRLDSIGSSDPFSQKTPPSNPLVNSDYFYWWRPLR